MNKTTKTVALFVVLSAMAVGCQKEDTESPLSESTISATSTMYTMQYAVNGVLYQTTLHSKAERSEFFLSMFLLAKEGNDVVFYDNVEVGQYAETKETVHYSTTNEKEAIAWAEKMCDDGYKVTVTYDPDKKVYNCVAWR